MKLTTIRLCLLAITLFRPFFELLLSQLVDIDYVEEVGKTGERKIFPRKLVEVVYDGLDVLENVWMLVA